MTWHYLHWTLQSTHGDQSIPALAAFLFTMGLMMVALLKGSRTKLVNAFIMNTFVIGFSTFCIYQLAVATDSRQGLFWARFMNGLAPMIAPTFFHFVTLLTRPDLDRSSRRALQVGYFIGFIFFLLSPTSLFIRGVAPVPGFFYYPLPGALFFFDMAYHSFYEGWGICRLIKSAWRYGNTKGSPIFYVLTAYIIGFAGGLQTFLPGLGLRMWKYGLYLVPLGFSILSYAILTKHLLDFRIVIRKTLLYSLISAALASVYVGTITLLIHFLGGRYYGSSSALSSALAAVFMTLLFNPLRIRLQRWLDRQFPHERLDPALLREAAGGFAHEMKRPLTKISLPAELALQDLGRLRTGELSLDEGLNKMEERLKFIMHQSIDAGSLIEAIRELSTASTAPFAAVDLGQLLEDTLQGEKELLARYGATGKLRLPSEQLIVSGHAKQLKIVFTNLIKNAAEAMGELPSGKPRELRIGLDAKGSQIIIDFEDSGPGIKPEDLGKIFQPHYTTKGPRGTGIGLYLSHNIILAHGGTIHVENAAAGGSVFQMRFQK